MKVQVFVSNHFQIALENGKVRNVESDQSRVQPNVRFRNILSKQIGLMAWVSEMFL